MLKVYDQNRVQFRSLRAVKLTLIRLRLVQRGCILERNEKIPR